MWKSIKEIAWNVSEEEYRNDEAYSYSTLSQFSREGVSCIPYLKDKKDSASLRFGSLTDTLLTESHELKNKFVVSDFNKPSDTIAKIVTDIWESSDKTNNNLATIDAAIILSHIIKENYQSNWKNPTRINKIIEEGQEYFKVLSESKDKVLMTQSDYNDAMYCVDVLKTNPYTAKYFYDNPFDKNVERWYQLKFKVKVGEYSIRCMFDRLIVDHVNKTIQPIDLKTTGKNEEDFEDSFESWCYYLQSSMYSYILRTVCLKDEYFKDFVVLPFMFICINRYNKKPVIWVDSDSIYDNNTRVNSNGKKLKGWYNLLQELDWHIKNKMLDYSYLTYKGNGKRMLSNLKLIK